MALHNLTLEKLVAEAQQLSPEDRVRLIQQVAQTLLPDTLEPPIGSLDPRTLLKRPMAERRRVLREQAAILLDYYTHDQAWRDFEAGDFVDD